MKAEENAGVQSELLDFWAIVEIFGHQRIAGKLTQQNVGASALFRIDVPETKRAHAFTRFYSPGAIYSISPVTEEIARMLAEKIDCGPINAWDMRQLRAPRLSEGADDPWVDEPAVG